MKFHAHYPMILVFLLGVSLAGSLTALAQTSTAAGQTDPIVGNWRWTVNRAAPGLMEIRADGTATLTTQNGPKWKWIKVDGKWKALPGTTVEQQYEILWNASSNIDKLALSQDGAVLYGVNSFKDKISGKRITDDASQNPQ
jgi:hypothetical protein